MLRLEYPTVICTVFVSYVTDLTNRNELKPFIIIIIIIIIIIRNAYDVHFPVLKRQHIIRGDNNKHKTLIRPAATYGK